MRRISIIMIFALPSIVYAQIPDAPLSIKVRQSNEGRCGWACLEALLQHHGWAKAAGAAAQKRGGMYLVDNGIDDCFQRLLVANREPGLGIAGIPPYRLAMPNGDAKPWAQLERSVEGRFGAIAIVQREGENPHAVVVVGMHTRGVTYIDPNDAMARKVTRAAFELWWTGWTITIYPNREAQEKWR